MSYIPDQRDIVYIDLDPQKGTELAKRRPCLVMSKRELNKKTHRIVVCPISSVKGFSSTHVPLPKAQKQVRGTIIVDQLRTLDFRTRNVQLIDKLSDLEIYDQVTDIIHLIVDR